MSIDQYLEGLVKEAASHDAEKAHLKSASVTELAELAGIKLAEDVCTECGSKMEKRGGMSKCSCGMMKGASAPAPKVKTAAKAPNIASVEASVEPEILEVGDRAGRLLAKTAAVGGLPMDELQESVEEAKGREDVEGRGKFWRNLGGAGGGALGGAAGIGAGAGLAKLIGKGRYAAPIALGAAGALGGGMAGGRFGKAHGEEEARADRAVSLIRALRSHQMGAARGFQAGARYGSGLKKTGGKLRRPFEKTGAAAGQLSKAYRYISSPVLMGLTGGVLGTGSSLASLDSKDSKRKKIIRMATGGLMGAGLGVTTGKLNKMKFLKLPEVAGKAGKAGGHIGAVVALAEQGINPMKGKGLAIVRRAAQRGQELGPGVLMKKTKLGK